MNLQAGWQASLIEQRTAWAIAALCVGLILAASSFPQWFDFSSEPAPRAGKSITPPAVQQAAATPKAAAAHGSKPVHHVQQPIQHKLPAAVKKSPEKPTATSNPASGYYIQMGAFKGNQRAKAMVSRLQQQGFTAHVIKRNQLHAVWIGPTNDRTGADQLHQRIARHLPGKGFIVHQN